jgi:hypothetical protein
MTDLRRIEFALPLDAEFFAAILGDIDRCPETRTIFNRQRAGQLDQGGKIAPLAQISRKSELQFMQRLGSGQGGNGGRGQLLQRDQKLVNVFCIHGIYTISSKKSENWDENLK